MTWIDCNEKMPDDMIVVIALYDGPWPGRGNSGIVDIYARGGHWSNVPESITVLAWMPIPDYSHIPLPERYTKSVQFPSTKMSTIETEIPAIFEYVFQDGDDTTPIKDGGN